MPPLSTHPPSRVLVIGAGVAGGSAAIRFAHLGNAVTLVERAVFPREKICGCCLGAAGLRALDAIGLGAPIRQIGTPTDRFVGYFQAAGSSQRSTLGRPIRLSIAEGVAISRSVLDSFLVDQAEKAGVRVWQPCEAQVVSSDVQRTLIRYRYLTDRQVQHPWQLTDEFDLVVVATGLSGNFSGSHPCGQTSHPGLRWQLPWIQSPHGPLGIAAHLPHDHPLAAHWKLDEGEIQMVCGAEGYVGLVRLPGGEIDIAAALRSRGQQSCRQRLRGQRLRGQDTCDTIDRLAALLLSHPRSAEISGDAVAKWLREEAQLMTAPPLRRSRSPGRHRVVLAGDSVGYVEPMTGEGMTWGIETGLAVADRWSDLRWQTDFAAHWEKQLRGLQRKRRILCGGVTWALRSASLRRAAHVGLTYAPWLAGPVIRGLAGGPSFVPTGASCRDIINSSN